MRGIVSLAAALALPTVMPEWPAFPARDLIIFLTFFVIADHADRPGPDAGSH
jgi:NhaP-type Na+/H+ or K+/H+ antiporter